MTHLLEKLRSIKKKLLERKIVSLDHMLCNNCSNKLHKHFGVKGGGHQGKPSKKMKSTKSTGKKHFMRVPIMKGGRKTGKTRSQAYIILASGKRKFVKN